jgi:hypothetical protein
MDWRIKPRIFKSYFFSIRNGLERGGFAALSSSRLVLGSCWHRGFREVYESNRNYSALRSDGISTSTQSFDPGIETSCHGRSMPNKYILYTELCANRVLIWIDDAHRFRRGSDGFKFDLKLKLRQKLQTTDSKLQTVKKASSKTRDR